MNRRGFILSALAAPLVVTTPGLLMPVKSFVPTPSRYVGDLHYDTYGGMTYWFDGKLWTSIID